ncbi:FAD/NAD(P)-binding protein [Paeniglutamicibacter sp. ABSL32-1]|uniref:FAD/NAD(P)-binding protein n=1 Tax=Paeniglutamicibacter quisquiliarum TaxID=2849498 RepID=UPI001C2D4055|nr:FAD/NAD(P)-binding domain-containing protein [Paeniglutamicibacter quisquiliarum]MBV1780218.1 FAD/NAD(P)-binding protein [Paeniglutamicibacter quisquiliarum]
MTRVAFIGGGPKCLFALLELRDRCPDAAAEGLAIDVFDPCPPGAGRVWQEGQPTALRLNVSAGILDAGPSAGPETFAQWVARVEPRYRGERYPPRVVVGRYLAEQFRHLAGTAAFGLTHVPALVTGVERAGAQWEVFSDAGSGLYDEVVLATGHGMALDAPGQPLASARNGGPLIGEYPALGEEGIPVGSRVLIRGAALTAYDAVLLLTEGRGGRWTESAGPESGTPWLRYIPGGREPSGITLASRSTLPMVPKPDEVPEDIRRCIDGHRQRVLDWGREIACLPAGTGAAYTGLFRILLSCALDCAERCGSPVTPLDLWRTALTGRTGEGQGTESAAENIRRSIRANHLQAPPTAQWLWARVWSGLYPEVVRAVSRVRWLPAQAKLFHRVSGQLERMAFGPPEGTALKLLALFDCGLLDQGPFPPRPPRDTVLLDAVTPPAGVLDSAAPGGRAMSPVIAGLLAAGEVLVREGERGLLTDADGTCIDANGNRNESLAALGRPTEGPTLGHDTLNRTLHPEPRSWARRIVRQRLPQHLGERS